MILTIWISGTMLTLGITAFIHGYTDGRGIPFALSWEESPLPFFVAMRVACDLYLAYSLTILVRMRKVVRLRKSQTQKNVSGFWKLQSKII